ncbi:hypothetical protein QTP88_019314 [Uroleucon formosanum]
MHFRRLLSLVYREFVAHVLKIHPHCVIREQIIVYSASLKLKRSRRADAIRCIFQALFQSDPIFQDVLDSTLRVNNKSNRFTENDFQPYHINRCWWKVCSDSDVFKPSDATLIDIDNIVEIYDNHINPMSKSKLQTRSTGNYGVSTRTIQRSSSQRSEEHSKRRPEIESYESQPSKYYVDQPSC